MGSRHTNTATESRIPAAPSAPEPEGRWEDLTGGFAARRLQSAGLDLVAESLWLGTGLQERDLQSLEEAPIALLGKLISVQRGEPGEAAASNALLRPLFLVPLAEVLERSGPDEALAAVASALESPQIHAFLERPGAVLSFAVDRWHGRFELAELAELLHRIVPSGEPSPLRLLGPSSRDIKEMIVSRGGSPEADETVDRFFSTELVPMLRTLGIDTIHGGTSLRIHGFARRYGLGSFIAHDLNRYRLRSQPDGETSFTRHLLAIRRELSDPAGAGLGWLPLFRSVLDRGSPGKGHPLGLEAVKAIALARLALPGARFIQAPLALFGVKAADIALRFGANDLGFAAVNRETAERLELPLLADAEESFSTTPVSIIHAEENL